MTHSQAFALARQPVLADRGLSHFSGPLIKAAAGISADLYIAHYPAALPAAARAARIHGGLYAFDAEDFHMGDLPDESEHDAVRDMVHAIEGRYLPYCAYVTADAPGTADAYAETYAIPRPTVLLNAFPRAQGPGASTPRGTATPGPSLYWFSQTIGPDRGLECAVMAIARARSQPHLYLRGSPARGYLDRLNAIAAEAHVTERLHLLPAATPSEMERLASIYDVGLSAEPGHTRNNRISLGNKIFTYLLAGVPILASEVTSHKNLAPSLPGALQLFAINDPDSLAAAMDNWLLEPKALEAARKTAWRFGAERFNWDVEQEVLLETVANALVGARGAYARPPAGALAVSAPY